jgi:hypothetical protein
VRLVGVLVALEEYERRWLMALDDGSGAVVEVVCFKPWQTQEKTMATTTTAQQKAAAARTAAAAAVDKNEKKNNQKRKKKGEEEEEEDEEKGKGKDDEEEEIPDLSGIDLGSVVKVKGRVSRFRDIRQVILKRISKFSFFFFFFQYVPFPSFFC